MTTADRLVFEGKRVLLKPLSWRDVTREYVSWLNDPEVNEFLEARFKKHTLASQKAYVKGFDQKTKFLWGIFDRKTKKHIGVITLYDIHPVHKYANYGYLIGNKQYWGTGAVQEAIALVFDFAFLKLAIHSISTGAYAPNIASVFNYKKMGLSYQGTFKERLWYKGAFVDQVWYGITRDEWMALRKKLAF